RDGVIRLDPLAAQLYEGSYTGSVGLDLRGKTPRVDLEQQLDGVQLGGLLADAAEIGQIDGTVHADMKLAGTGLSEGELLRSLAGPLSFRLSDGLYKGMDIWQEIRRARALVKGKSPPPAEGPPQTKITDLQMAGQLANGVMRSDRLLAEIPFLRMTGTGSVDLLKQSMDYRLQAEVFDRPEFDGEQLDDLTGLVIPLTVTGDVESPKIGVDLAGLAKSVAGKKLQDKLFEKLGLDKSGDNQDTEQGGESQSTEDSLKRDLKKLLPF
ncbi:MAG TPA: AsmA family protein, partial [Chromatiales bacterium]|nr:AsmA family protein [Chromatiales bacterium]